MLPGHASNNDENIHRFRAEPGFKKLVNFIVENSRVKVLDPIRCYSVNLQQVDAMESDVGTRDSPWSRVPHQTHGDAR